MHLHVDKTDDGQPLIHGRAPVYGLAIGHSIRNLSVLLAHQNGLVSDEISYRIEEALQTTHQYVPHLPYAEPEHTVFDRTAILCLLASKYGYKR